MSCVYIHTVKPKSGRLCEFDEVRNASAFYWVLWEMLSRRFGYRNLRQPCLFADRSAMRMVETDEVCRRLPRQPALVLAATFDRCWFPSRMLAELAGALDWAASECRESRVPTIETVAAAIRRAHAEHPRRGIALEGSTACTWWNGDEDRQYLAHEGTDATTIVAAA